MTLAYSCWDLAELSQGRFLLGLGSQVRGHIVRRFSMPWDSPGPRMREFVMGLRAIWRSWQDGVPLDFHGKFYSFSLMTPFFNPGPIAHPAIPIYLAGVGDYMCRLAGELADGIHVHPFHTIPYLDQMLLPQVAEGAAQAGRARDRIETVATVFVITGRSRYEMDTMEQAVRLQVAFYASTPSYRGILELHGWDFGDELTARSRRGDWMGMAALIPDEVLTEVAVRAPLDELGAAIRGRFGERVGRIGFYIAEIPGMPPVLALSDDEWESLVAATRG